MMLGLLEEINRINPYYTLFGVFFWITAYFRAKSDRESVHLLGSNPIFPFANPSITVRDNSITSLPSSFYVSTSPPLLVFAFDIVQAAVSLFVGLGSPMPHPDFHGIERSGTDVMGSQEALSQRGFPA